MDILFDLDGTLTDSGEGIINSARLIFEHYGLPTPSLAELKAFVGPPLVVSLAKHGVPAEKFEEAIGIYRGRCKVKGMYENFPYPGIEALLRDLKAMGHSLYVATSKPEYLARGILEHFQLDSYFDIIRGAADDDSRSKKADVIRSILEVLPQGRRAIMVGDTIYDVLGAQEAGIPVIGVAWGYGKVSEMTEAGATVVQTMAQLKEMIGDM